jgi:hypothetical protein
MVRRGWPACWVDTWSGVPGLLVQLIHGQERLACSFSWYMVRRGWLARSVDTWSGEAGLLVGLIHGQERLACLLG